jgi:hypothetical protein
VCVSVRVCVCMSRTAALLLGGLLAAALGLRGRRALLGAALVNQVLVDVGDDTTLGDGGGDERVQLLVTYVYVCVCVCAVCGYVL